VKQGREEIKKTVRTLYRYVVLSKNNCYLVSHSIGMIKMKARKWDPFRPPEFARLAQRHFDAANKAIQE